MTAEPRAGGCGVLVFCMMLRCPGRLCNSTPLGRVPNSRPMLLRTPTSFIGPCLPSSAEGPPSGPEWVHEIKHDGYRLMARRDPIGIRLLTRNGHDWSPRYPLIVEAVNRLKARSCLVDGEAVACDDNGVAVFQRLRRKPSGKHVFLFAFDLLELDGEDLRREPFETRKATLASLLRGCLPGLRIKDAVSWRRGVPPCLQDGPRRDRVEAARLALHVRPLPRLAQVQEPGGTGCEAQG